VVIHAGGWYNWRDFPEFNRDIVTGGSRGHDRLGEFEVKNIRPDHPVMKNVPASFKITDELYNFQPDAAGPEREVLATATSPVSGKTFPIVWVTKGKGARIVCITLGHDGRAHDLQPYKALLENSIRWSAGR